MVRVRQRALQNSWRSAFSFRIDLQNARGASDMDPFMELPGETPRRRRLRRAARSVLRCVHAALNGQERPFEDRAMVVDRQEGSGLNVLPSGGKGASMCSESGRKAGPPCGELPATNHRRRHSAS